RPPSVLQLAEGLLGHCPPLDVDGAVDLVGLLRQVGHHEATLAAPRRPLAFGHQPPGLGPAAGLVVLDLLETLHPRVARAVGAVLARQGLVALRRVVGGVHVQEALGRRRDPGAAKQIQQEVMDYADTLPWGGTADQQDLRLPRAWAPPRVGVWEARQRRASG